MRIDEFVEKSEEESNKEPKDYIKFIYFELDRFPNLIGSQQTSPIDSPKCLEAIKLHPAQLESQCKGPKSQ